MVVGLCLVVGLVCAGLAAADVTLPSMFSDHMVMQQGIAVPVWGWAAAGEQVTVRFAGQVKQTTAEAQGRWAVKLDPMTAAPGQRGRILRVEGKNKLTIRDVLIGEVWVCSGQSNMQFATGSSMNGAEEVAAANFPQIRLFTVPDLTAPMPMDTCNGAWTPCSPESVASFTAVGYFFGRKLNQDLKIPVGLIHTSWGGTVAQAWTSAPALRAKLPEFDKELDQVAGPQADYQKAVGDFRAKMVDYNAAVNKMYDLEEDLTVAAKYAAPDYDDHDWKTMNLPGNWTQRGIPNPDGIVWVRKTLQLPAAWAGQDLILHPGPIDEVETTWFNGEQVGGRGHSRTKETQYWNQPRDYRVPGRLVHAGANVVAIRVSNQYGDAGLIAASPDLIYAESAGADRTHVSLAGDWRYWIEYQVPPAPGDPTNPNRASVLFNAMINPLIPYGIRGAIWYQGESNAGNSVEYRTLLPTMITDWRTRWGEGNFPFGVVSLANFMARSAQPEDTDWAQLREAQAMTAADTPNVGLALAIDIGDAGNIHPTNKQEVGRRLALWAEAETYGMAVPYSGPVYQSMQVMGGKVALSFLHADGGLVAKDGPLTGFSICGPDKKFVWAQAAIQGNQVVVSADGVTQPVAVRYAWANNPACNLYNGAGLPALPFRTDHP